MTSEDCRKADELYKTWRVMGSLSLRSDERHVIYDHAAECPRKDWHHALPTALWDITERERTRRGTNATYGNINGSKEVPV